MRNGASTHGIKSNPIAAYVTVPGGNQMRNKPLAMLTPCLVAVLTAFDQTQREREGEQKEEFRAGTRTAARNWTPLESNRNLKCTLGAFSFSAP